MSNTYNKQLMRIVASYRGSHDNRPASAREIAHWAYSRGLWEPQAGDLISRCVDELSRAMREEYIVDAQGRSVRAMHVARREVDGHQIPIWDHITTASRAHMLIAFQTRRRQVLGDCRQLKTDVDSYNDNRSLDRPIQVSFNFGVDLEEEALARAALLRPSAGRSAFRGVAVPVR